MRQNRKDEIEPASGRKAWKRVLTMKGKNLVFENRTKIHYLKQASISLIIWSASLSLSTGK